MTHPAHRAVIVLKTALGETGMLAYTSYMAERLAEMHRLLKPTGTLWLHCDQTASHYLKIALDLLFGARALLQRDYVEEVGLAETAGNLLWRAERRYLGLREGCIASQVPQNLSRTR